LLKIASTTEDTDTTWLAIRGIGRLRFKDAAPFLKQSLSSRSNYVRANAACALGEIHDVSATPDLMRTLKNEQDSGVIEQTALALQMLGALKLFRC
jgi:HEAT repeat protein